MSFWTSLRDGVESAASIAGNYFVPGSSLLTSHLTSQGSQDQLNSTLGRIAQVVSGAAGAYNLLDSAGNVIGTTDAAGASQAVSAGAADGAGVGAAGAGAYSDVAGEQYALSQGAGAAGDGFATAGATGAASGASGATGGGLLGTIKSGIGMAANGAGLLSALGGVAGAVGGSKQSGTTTTTNQQQLDPRMQAILYGNGTAGSNGLLGKITSAGNQPQSSGLAEFGKGTNSYLADWGTKNFMTSQQAAQRLQGGSLSAPQMQAAQAQAAKIAAPSQNNIDLSGTYDRFINGNAGANPYLTQALQSAVDQTNASYQKNQTYLTNNLQRNILPGIGSDAVLAGQYGGTRQGIAQGNALSDYTNQLNNSNLQLGLANSANTTGQQASAFNQGQDRSLAATQGLGGQQYGVAMQDAQNQQQANMLNASFEQQAKLSNMQSDQATNQLNSANTATGVGLSSGLLGQAYNYGTANDAYDRNKAGQVAGQIGQFTGLGGSSSTSTPYYTNPVGNILGGATAGLGLYNAYNQAQANSFGNTNNQFLNNNQGLLNQNFSQSDLYSAA